MIWRSARTGTRLLRRAGWLLFSSTACLLLALSAGCREIPASPELIQLDGVEPGERPGELWLRGSGFPAGHRCELRWQGVIFTPAAAARELEVRTPCRALSDSLALASSSELPLGSGARVTYEGRLELLFAGSDAQGGASGALPNARLRLRNLEASSPAQRLALGRRALAFRQALGALEVESDARGLVLTKLAPGGALARAGLAEGDAITRFEGAPVEDALDFVGASERPALQLHVLRQDAATAVPVRVSRDLQAGPSVLLVLVGLLGAFTGFVLPRRPRPGRARAASAAWLGWSAALLALSWWCFGALDARIVWLVPLSVHLLHVASAYLRGQLASATAIDECIELGIATLGIAALGVPEGVLHTPLHDGTHGALPWSWPLFAAPGAWLGLSVLAGRRAQHAFAPRTHAALHAGKVLALGAFALGAGRLPPELAMGAAAGLLALLVLALKLPLAALLLRWEPPFASRWQRATVALLAPGLALLAAAVIPLGSPVSLLLGAGVLGLSLGVALQRKQGPLREDVRDPSLAPFL